MLGLEMVDITELQTDVIFLSKKKLKLAGPQNYYEANAI